MKNIAKMAVNPGSKTVNKAIAGPGSSVLVPTSIWRDRDVAVLESLVEYLKDAKGFSFHEIGMLLNRDERNVWTVYSRAKKKRKSRR